MIDRSHAGPEKKWFDNKRLNSVLSLPLESSDKLKRLEQERNWATKVAAKVGAEFINGGVGGSSQGAINYRTVIDIERLMAGGITIDKVFIQITSFSRIELFKESEEYSVVSRLAGQANHYKDYSDKMFTKHWAIAEPEPGQVIRFLANIVYIRNYVKSRLGFDPIFVDSLFGEHLSWISKCAVEDNFKQIDEIRTLAKASGIMNPVSLKSNMLSMQDVADTKQKHFCPGQHYAPIVHEQFADYIIDHYFK